MTKRISKLQRFTDGMKYQQMVDGLRYIQRGGVKDSVTISEIVGNYDSEIEKIKEEYGEKVVAGYNHERSKLAQKIKLK